MLSHFSNHILKKGKSYFSMIPYPLLFGLCFFCLTTFAQNSVLEEIDQRSNEARPQVWWHWMNGNISQDGIRKDLLWMHRIGIGGVHIFDANVGTPQITKQRVTFMSPEWRDAFAYATRLADSLGLSIAIASSPGWSATGGPWVNPEDAMKTLNWKEMVLEGGKKYKGPLPEPNTVAGKYLTHILNKNKPEKYRFYKDLFVYAVKMSDKDLTMEDLGITITASSNIDTHRLMDEDLMTKCIVKPDSSGKAWIMFELAMPQTIKAIMQGYDDDRRDRSARTWEYSNDGVHFHTLLDACPKCGIPFLTFNIPATTAKYLRVSALNAGDELDYNEIKFHTINRVQFDTEKAGFFSEGVFAENHPTESTDNAVKHQDIIDITDRYKNGILRWNIPEGRWRIYRIGYTLRGRQNGPASPEGTGLEVNKLDKDAVIRYYRNYLNLLKQTGNDSFDSSIKCLMIDSYEAGAQTWTDNMAEEFEQRRGYSMKKWFPALFGEIVEDAESTDLFLHDWRQTFGELFVENHYYAVDSILAEYHLTSFVESHECDRKVPADGMDMKLHAHIPMGAFWINGDEDPAPCHDADIRESASVAHIFGQNIVAAESFTADGRKTSRGIPQAYTFYPDQLKPYADRAMANGLNQFVIHCSPHQPADDKKPGLSLGPFGQWFTRHETWAEEAKPWMDYLTRSSYLLRQGVFAADFAILYNENSNLTAIYKDLYPPEFDGHSYDFINANILLHYLKLKDNELITPTGTHYKAILIDSATRRMSIDVLRKLAECVRAGVLVAGEAPVGRLNLMDDETEFQRLVNEIWHSDNPNTVAYADFEKALNERCAKQIAFATAAHADIHFVHRHLNDGELYWLANFSSKACDENISFNITGKKTVIYHAETGLTENASFHTDSGWTTVPLHFTAHDALFVLFEENTQAKTYTSSAQKHLKEFKTLEGPWTVTFPKDYGAPDTVLFMQLDSWINNPLDGIKYFSGTATYRQTFELVPSFDTTQSYLLNLGIVRHLARVKINGTDLGVLWKFPFQTDVSHLLHQGENTLEIQVTNVWHNRMIGDLQSSNPQKNTYSSYPFFTADSPLIESGLIGPVRLLIQQ